jgi:hypothetical protein
VFYAYFYNHARRPRLEKLLHLELSRSPNGFFKPLLTLLDPGGRLRSRFGSEAAMVHGTVQIYNVLCPASRSGF